MAALEGEPVVAFDTEADSFYRYQEQVCLIQISTPDQDFLVDPLKGFDFGELGDVLAAPDQVKVFHDGEYDVLILKRQFGFQFRNLFDTRVAAAALGVDAPGLGSVVGERFGVELDKSLQRSNWSARPLTSKQIDYARLDTRYLIPLMEEFQRELDERGRTMILEGECRRLEALEPPRRGFDPDEFVRIKGARKLKPIELQVLRELYILRDRLAKARDVPPFKVVGNHVLLEVARSRPRSIRSLERVQGLSPKIVRRIGRELCDSVRAALDKGPLSELPRLPAKDGTSALDEAGVELHDRLKGWRKKQAVADGIDASLILNRHVLVRLAKDRPENEEQLSAVEGMLPWQVDLFRDDILGVIASFEDDLANGRIQLRRRRR